MDLIFPIGSLVMLIVLIATFKKGLFEDPERPEFQTLRTILKVFGYMLGIGVVVMTILIIRRRW